ncbi:MAG: arylsulfatase [Phycisphaeraceae bacterium]|nr:arylsulfatase [Phycisphaeraceae bacterium]
MFASIAMPAWAERRALGPNIVFILADDMGYGDARCYNADSKVPTPNIDKLAKQGMRFTDAHTPSSVCTPTRYGFLTGRYPWRSRLARGIVWFWDPPLIEDNRTTLPEMLRATPAQYATACMGKWHLGWAWEDAQGRPVKTRFGHTRGERLKAIVERIDFTRAIPGGPLDHGFDRYFGDDVPNFPPYTFFEDNRLAEQPTEAKPGSMYGRPGPMAPGWDLQLVQPEITERAIEYILSREQRGEPFFLYMPLNIPHTPIVPDEPYQGKSGAGRYGDFVAQVDGVVGRVIGALEDAGLADNTIVVFTSDNGSPARSGKKGSGPTHSVTKEFGHVPNAPWRGLKADIWEAGHRVPHIVRWPGVVRPGTTTNQVVCLTDWYATFADLHAMELEHNQAEDSFSMLGLLQGNDTPIRESVVHHSLNGTLALRKGDWKLIEGNLGSGGFSKPGRVAPKPDGPQGQLYNLADDPKESTNRWLDEPAVVETLLAELKAIRDAGRSR